MSLTAPHAPGESAARTVRFRRASGVFWRDTGRHVVAVDGRPGAPVRVLGGGGAVVWRLLQTPATLEEIVQAFAPQGGAAPSRGELLACLTTLCECGLVTEEGP